MLPGTNEAAHGTNAPGSQIVLELKLWNDGASFRSDISFPPSLPDSVAFVAAAHAITDLLTLCVGALVKKGEKEEAAMMKTEAMLGLTLDWIAEARKGAGIKGKRPAAESAEG
jgi:hypothetical protein